jgi:hypothetical protein
MDSNYERCVQNPVTPTNLMVACYLVRLPCPL